MEEENIELQNMNQQFEQPVLTASNMPPYPLTEVFSHSSLSIDTESSIKSLENFNRTRLLYVIGSNLTYFIKQLLASTKIKFQVIEQSSKYGVILFESPMPTALIHRINKNEGLGMQCASMRITLVKCMDELAQDSGIFTEDKGDGEGGEEGYINNNCSLFQKQLLEKQKSHELKRVQVQSRSISETENPISNPVNFSLEELDARVMRQNDFQKSGDELDIENEEATTAQEPQQPILPNRSTQNKIISVSSETSDRVETSSQFAAFRSGIDLQPLVEISRVQQTDTVFAFGADLLLYFNSVKKETAAHVKAELMLYDCAYLSQSNNSIQPLLPSIEACCPLKGLISFSELVESNMLDMVAKQHHFNVQLFMSRSTSTTEFNHYQFCRSASQPSSSSMEQNPILISFPSQRQIPCKEVLQSFANEPGSEITSNKEIVQVFSKQDTQQGDSCKSESNFNAGQITPTQINSLLLDSILQLQKSMEVQLDQANLQPPPPSLPKQENEKPYQLTKRQRRNSKRHKILNYQKRIREYRRQRNILALFLNTFNPPHHHHEDILQCILDFSKSYNFCIRHMRAFINTDIRFNETKERILEWFDFNNEKLNAFTSMLKPNECIHCIFFFKGTYPLLMQNENNIFEKHLAPLQFWNPNKFDKRRFIHLRDNQ